MVCNDFQGYVMVYRDIQGYAMVHKEIYYNGIMEYIRKCRGVGKTGGTFKGIWGDIRIAGNHMEKFKMRWKQGLYGASYGLN